MFVWLVWKESIVIGPEKWLELIGFRIGTQYAVSIIPSFASSMRGKVSSTNVISFCFGLHSKKIPHSQNKRLNARMPEFYFKAHCQEMPNKHTCIHECVCVYTRTHMIVA